MDAWLEGLAVPVYQELQESKERRDAARREIAEAEKALAMAEAKMGGIMQLAEAHGVTEDDIAQAAKAKPPIIDTRPSLSTSDLMTKAAEFLKASGYPRTVDDITKALEEQGIKVPPRSNLLAYISRSDRIKTVKRGLYVAAE